MRRPSFDVSSQQRKSDRAADLMCFTDDVYSRTDNINFYCNFNFCCNIYHNDTDNNHTISNDNVLKFSVDVESD